MICKAEPGWETPEVGVDLRRYFLCPECKEHQHFYGHLLNEKVGRVGSEYGPWYCHKCGLSVDIKLLPNQQIAIKARTDRPRWVRKLVLLKRDNIYLVIDHSTFDDFTEDQIQYYFNQHTCPTNYFRDTLAILIPPFENDPHGLFEYVATAEATVKDVPNTSAQDLFKHFGFKA